MKIVVTGAGGLVGRQLIDYFGNDHDLIPLRHGDLDIANANAVDAVLERERPDLIFNCAVIGVDECESDPRSAHAVNVGGPANLARAADRIGASIVHFSTNYVFDGERREGYYTIDDEPRPVNVYGRTKLEGEQAVVSECGKNVIIRTSWVFGPTKDNFYGSVHKRLKAGEHVEVSDDLWASTTCVNDLVERVSAIVENGIYGTYHVVNSGVCSKFDFAVEAARCVGVADERIDRQVRRISESDLGRGVKRPAYTPIKCTLSEKIGLAPLRDWRDALRTYIDKESVTS